jgi:hypothetical protein
MKRIQRKRTRGWRMPPNTVYVGRPTKWGNPYHIAGFVSREGAVRNYHIWLRERLVEDPHFLDELKDKDLACWCRLDEPCHADILLKFLSNMEYCDHNCKHCPSKAVCVASPFRGM